MNPDIYEELKRLCRSRGVSVSQEIDELIKKRVAELEGREYDVTEADYEALKREFFRLVQECDRLRKVLEKHGSRRKLLKLTVKIMREMGVEKIGGVLKEVSAEILRRWQGSRDDAHLYISLLELEKRKAEVLRRLEKMRINPRANGMNSLTRQI
ncbi:hypothetical protein CW705_02805 [Candidatus Bathyarchaeota archaeon]|nr:MAG: hypothetical protein CW705_02805 [Candidatus Bathyarchaeota archaeon]